MGPTSRSRTRGTAFVCAVAAVALALLANASVLRADAPSPPHAPSAQWSPAVAAGLENSLGVWMDTRPNDSISGTRVSPDGVVLDPNQIWISMAPGAQDFPDVAFGGQNYLVAWQDERVSGFREICTSRVSPTGDVLDPSGIPLSTGRVPGVIGLSLVRARSRIRTNHCSVGAVRRVRVKHGRGTVLAQRPSAGATRRRGYPVRLTVGRR